MRLRKGLRVCLLICLAAVSVLIMAAACSSSGEGDNPAVPPTLNQPAPEQKPPTGEAGDADTNGGNRGNVPEPDEETATNGNAQPETLSDEMNGSAGQLYAITFEAMMELEEALNDEMNYIAVDLSEMTQLTEDDKTYIIKHLQSFGTEIRDRTLEQLIQEEKPDQDLPAALKGVLLRINKVEITEDSARIEGSKYRSGTGAVGARITLKLEQGAWKLADSEMIRIS